MVIYDVQRGTEERIPTSPAPAGEFGSTATARSGPINQDTLPDIFDASNFSQMNKVGNPDYYPRRTGVQLFLTFIDGTDTTLAICSGTLINPWYVLTAGHCVYDDDRGGWADAVGVAPARNGPSFPYGVTQAVSYMSWPGWIDDGDWDHDVALIRLENPVGALTGWRNVGYNSGCNWFTGGDWERYSYPGAGAYTGRFMYRDQGDYNGCETYGNEVWFDRPGVGGTSGAGAVRNGAVYTVRSNTYPDPFTWLDGWDTRLTGVKFSGIVDAIANFTPDATDFMAFDAKIDPPQAPVGGTLSGMDFVLFNNAEVGYNGPVAMDVYISLDAEITSSDVLLGTHMISWDVGASASERITIPDYGISGTLPVGEYYVGAIVTTPDADGSNNATPGFPLALVCQALSVPVPVSPAQGAICEPTGLSFDWTSIPLATGYRIQIGSDCGLGSVFQSSWSGYAISGLDLGTTYHWRVRGDLPCGGSGAWSNCFHFTTMVPAPTAPILQYPEDGDGCEDSTPRLFWSTPPFTSEFQLQFGTSCGTGVLITVLENGFSLEQVSPETTYTWRVRMLDDCNQWSDWSSCRSFTTGPAQLAPPNLVSPVDGSDCVALTPTLFWSSVPGADFYQLRVFEVIGDSHFILSLDDTTALHYTLPQLNPGQEYNWVVAAVDTCGNRSSDGARFSFVTGFGAPPAPIELEPGTATACTDSTANLEWLPVAAAEMYEVRWGLACPISSPLYLSTTTTGTGIRVSLPDTTVYWTVRAKYTCSGWGDWADCVSFAVSSADPVLSQRLMSTTHEMGEWSNQEQVSLDWYAETTAGCLTITGFSLVMDQSPATLPDTIPELTAGPGPYHTAISIFPEGDDQYAHVRVLAKEEPADSAVHYGPIRIDLTPPAVTLHSPDGGEVLVEGSSVDVNWSAADALSGLAAFQIDMSADGGASYLTIAEADSSDTTWSWTVPSAPGSQIQLRVVATDVAGNSFGDESDAVFSIVTTTGVGDGPTHDTLFLGPSRPNPFHDRTRFHFSVPEGHTGSARLEIFDALGRRIRTLATNVSAAGVYNVAWDGRDEGGRTVAAGVYFGVLRSGSATSIQRLLRLN